MGYQALAFKSGPPVKRGLLDSRFNLVSPLGWTAFPTAAPAAGDTLGEAIDQTKDAIDFHCQTLIEDGGDVPPARALAEHRADPDFAGWIWAVVEVPVERYFGPAEKINITLPRLLLAQIDERIRARGGTRSGFLAEAARAAMR